MAPLRHAVHILPDLMIAARQAGDAADRTLLAPLDAKLDLLADDLAWWTEALNAPASGMQRARERRRATRRAQPLGRPPR